MSNSQTDGEIYQPLKDLAADVIARALLDADGYRLGDCNTWVVDTRKLTALALKRQARRWLRYSEDCAFWLQILKIDFTGIELVEMLDRGEIDLDKLLPFRTSGRNKS